MLKPTSRFIQRFGALGVLLPVLFMALPAHSANAQAAPVAEVSGGSDAPAGSPAQAAIGRFNERLLSMMQQADSLGYLGRFDFVAPTVRETFDMSFMAHKTIGKYSAGLSPEEQQRWVKTFEDFTISNLADRFHGYSGQSFEVVGEKPASRNTLVVLTVLRRTGGAEDVELNYRMRESEDGWRVIDVYSKGKVSEIALRRAEYSRSLKKGGIELLIDTVAKMTARRAAPAS